MTTERQPVCSRCMRELGGIAAMRAVGGWPQAAGEVCSLCGQRTTPVSPPAPRRVRARFSGTCHLCRQHFNAGTDILVQPGQAPQHADCKAAAEAASAEAQRVAAKATATAQLAARTEREAAAMRCGRCGAAIELGKARTMAQLGIPTSAVRCPTCNKADEAAYTAKRAAERSAAIAASIASAERCLHETHTWGQRLAQCLDSGHQWPAEGGWHLGDVCTRCGAVVRREVLTGDDEAVSPVPGPLYVESWAGQPSLPTRPWALYEQPQTGTEKAAWDAAHAAVEAAMAPIRAERERRKALEHAAFMRHDAQQLARRYPTHGSLWHGAYQDGDGSWRVETV